MEVGNIIFLVGVSVIGLILIGVVLMAFYQLISGLIKGELEFTRDTKEYLEKGEVRDG